MVGWPRFTLCFAFFVIAAPFAQGPSTTPVTARLDVDTSQLLATPVKP